MRPVEERPPRLRGNEQAFLVTPIIREVDSIVVERKPLVDVAHVERQQIVAQAVHLPGPIGEVHHEVLHPPKLLHLLEEGDPPSAGVVLFTAAFHVAAVQPPARGGRGEVRPVAGLS